MATSPQSKPSVEVLRVAIEEQRRFHDELTEAYHGVSVKILTLAGGGLALLTFLYSNPADPKNPLFIPQQLYGKIIYFAALLSTLAALGLLIHGIKPTGQWEVAPETEALESLDETDEHKYLLYVKNRYVACFKNNLKEYSFKHKYLKLSFYPLVFGAIILVVIKLFGAQ